MRRAIMLLGVPAIVAGLYLLSTEVCWASGPETQLNVGAVMPLSKYKRSVDGNVGGTFGLAGGYRFDLTDNFALSLLANPQFTFLPTDERRPWPITKTVETSSVFGITAGPKFTLITGDLETYVGAQGGYYHDMSGPKPLDNGAGFNAGGGINYQIGRGTSIGLFARYDYAMMDARPTSDVDRQWVLAGFALQHVYGAAPVVAQAPPPPPAPKPTPAPVRKIVLRGVNFDFDKSNIRADARPILDEAVRTLAGEPDINISVEGHTDNIGTDAYNEKLSLRRAHAVASYLTKGRITQGRMTVTGYGESKPVASNATADGRAQNRRVELRIVGQ
jgi:outer membrane protein OmpA-like peptidoglycan-associated protein